ncbi:hypothetical protein ACIOK4_42915 [Streptomyces bottropensis]|uniref:hypothetical protein n=1 Tax=Streptomyces bottropensis TaxID=42235 RepID=UPI003824849E
MAHNTPSAPDTYIKAYAASVEEACRTGRQDTRKRTQLRLVKVPDAAMPIGGITLLLIVTIVTVTHWGISTAAGLPIGALSAALFTAVNDVRISVVHDNPGWRRRHRILARIVPRHPGD